MKKIWITSLAKDERKIQQLMTTLKPYGMPLDGHFWVDDLKKMAWSNVIEPIMQKEVALWVILADKASLEVATIRKGLSLLAMVVQHGKGVRFPVLILSLEGDLTSDKLPVLLKGADILPLSTPTLGAKVVALANVPVQKIDTGYRITLHPLGGIGLWFEVGPSGDIDWPGALFAVNGAEIDFHGIGPADGIPERSTLEYPVKGLKINYSGEEYTGWGVQNTLKKDTSYYVRIQGVPDKILFGHFPTSDDAEMYAIALC